MFEGSTNPADAELWLMMLDKCFKVMDCYKEREVNLATFLFLKEVESWWKTFKSIFEDKYYPSTYFEIKRDEFLSLEQRIFMWLNMKGNFLNFLGMQKC